MSIAKIRDGRERFFAYARERHAVYLRRQASMPQPWSEEPALQRYRFTNVFRELDKTTAWFREHVRDPLRDRPEVLLATVLFRMLNRIATGEAVFLQKDLITGETAWDLYLQGDQRALKRAVVSYVGRKGPYVTGAYIISSPPGVPKLDGVLKIVDWFSDGKALLDLGESEGMHTWRTLTKAIADERKNGKSLTLEQMFDWLSQFPWLGTFHSYEIVTDLRHTALLENAQDIMTWANIGPGARRGMNRIMNRPRPRVSSGRKRWGLKVPKEQMLEEMRELLEASRDARYWPHNAKSGMQGDHAGFARAKDWPEWELREVEHTLCEFDKISRVWDGDGAPRGRFP